MKNLSNYIGSLKFKYSISYSGLRGDKFDKLKELNNNKIGELRKEIKMTRFMHKPNLKKEIKNLEKEINIYNTRIINSKNITHKSAEQIHKFQLGDSDLNEILGILNTKFEEQHFSRCLPIFRDAIVFYSNEDEIVGIIHVCFSCSYMKNEKEENFEVDYKIFPKIMAKLIELGHSIENK